MQLRRLVALATVISCACALRPGATTARAPARSALARTARPSTSLNSRAAWARDRTPGLFGFGRLPRALQAASASIPATADKGGLLQTQTSKVLWRGGWTSWWIQLVLTVIAGITLLFARTFADPGQSALAGASSGLFLSAGGIFLSAASVFWTWGFTRVAKRIARKGKEELTPRLKARLIRRALRTGVVLNLAGRVVTLFGAEQIVGTLVAKVLSFQGVSGPVGGAYVSPTATLRALDIFLVQASANALLSHLCSLTITLWLTWVTRASQIALDDPPSK